MADGLCVRYPGGGRQTADPSLSRTGGWVREGIYDSPLGKVSSGWEYTQDGIRFSFVIPSNSRAVVTLPDGERELERGSIPFFFLMRWNEFQRCYRVFFRPRI